MLTKPGPRNNISFLGTKNLIVKIFCENYGQNASAEGTKC